MTTEDLEESATENMLNNKIVTTIVNVNAKLAAISHEITRLTTSHRDLKEDVKNLQSDFNKQHDQVIVIAWFADFMNRHGTKLLMGVSICFAITIYAFVKLMIELKLLPHQF